MHLDETANRKLIFDIDEVNPMIAESWNVIVDIETPFSVAGSTAIHSVNNIVYQLTSVL